MRVARVDPSGLDAGAVGFRLAPRINAVGRLYRADAGVELLLTEDEGRAATVAAELDAANAERRAVEQRIAWEAEAQVRELGPRPAYVLAGEGWHPGVIGIVASRIAERHHRPAILVALDEASGTGTGSGRSIPGFDLLGALHVAAPLLERYGGHRAAAGLTIATDQVDALRDAIETHAATTLRPEDLVPRERVDAVVGGPQLGLALADELAQLEPCGMGNPAVNLLVPGATFTDVRPMGEEGRHARFTVEAGGARCRAVSFGCDGRVPVAPDELADATFRLERNSWNGAVEARLLLRHATPCAPPPIEVLGEPAPDAWLDAVLRDQAAAAPQPWPTASIERGIRRQLVDHRGEGATAVLRELTATGEPVLVLVADIPRRIAGLATRAGGFALCSHAALARQPDLAERFTHVVALDPPATADEDARMRAAGPRDGAAFVHLAWGQAELRFARQIHESEYGLRAALVPLYRVLRDAGAAAGEELERLLRGDGSHGRSTALAARLVGVLEELGLVSLDRDLQSLRVVEAERTELERSATYRAASTRYEDGLRFLAKARTAAETRPTLPTTSAAAA
jgi:single-stranded-DNA-specific exonuclease